MNTEVPITNTFDLPTTIPTTTYLIPAFKNKEEEDEHARTHTRKCTKCGAEKCLAEFGNNTSGSQPFDKHGYRLKRPECKDCTKSAGKGLAHAKRVAKQTGVSTTPANMTCAQYATKKAMNAIPSYLTTTTSPTNSAAGCAIHAIARWAGKATNLRR